MSKEHLPVTLADGSRRQSGIPTRAAPDRPLRAQGLLLKGVVTATYVVDDTSHFQNDGRAPAGIGGRGAIAIYCDVLSYTNVGGMRWRFIPRCLVLQDRGGIHDGKVWKPRAATLDVTGNALDLDKATNPANLDGDHVLVGFVNDHLNEPIILGGVPHPNADAGVGESQQRQRLQLRSIDGDPEFQKHHGSIYGIDDNGDYVVDTRFANDGSLETNGQEKDPVTDGSGSQYHSLPKDAEHKITLWDMSSPESPVEKAVVTFDNTSFHVEYVDSGFELFIDDSGSIIHLGGDAGGWISRDDLVQGELGNLKNDVNNLKWELSRHRHPLGEFPIPLLFGDITSIFKAPAVYTVKGQKPINLRTGAEVKENGAPMDKDAGSGEFFGAELGPTTADLFTEASTLGSTNSDTVKVKS